MSHFHLYHRRQFPLKIVCGGKNEKTKQSKPIENFNFRLRFTHSETLSNFFCDKCQMSMSASIKLTISQAPIVACFHLKVKPIV